MGYLPRIQIKWPTQCIISRTISKKNYIKWITSRTTAFTGDINLDPLFIWYSLSFVSLFCVCVCVLISSILNILQNIFSLTSYWEFENNVFLEFFFHYIQHTFIKIFLDKYYYIILRVSFYFPHFCVCVCISVVSFTAFQFWCLGCNSVLSSHILFFHVFQPWALNSVRWNLDFLKCPVFGN